MDNSQILQEIDIIVRAKIDEAKKDINNIKKEVKKMVNDFSKDFNEMNINDSFKDIGKQFKNARKDIQKVQEEVRKIKVNIDDGISFAYDSGDLDDLNQKLEDARKKQEELREKMSKPIESTIQQVVSTNNVQEAKTSTPNSNSNDTSLLPNTNNIDNSIQETIKKVKDLQNEFGRLEQQKLDPYQVMNLKNAISMLKEEFVNTIPYLSNIRQSIRDSFSDANDPIAKVANSFIELKNQATSSISSMTSNVKSNFDGIKEKVSSTIKPATDLFKNTGTVAKRIFEEVKEKVGGIGDKIGNPIKKIKNLITHFHEAKNNAEKIKKSSSGIGDSLIKGISSGITSIKKFVMGLLSVRSAYTLVSRAASAYLSFDTQLSDSIQNSWNVLGSLLAPMLEYVASLFSKLVSAVAGFVKALTGIDLVARANAKALDKQAKSANNANKQLSSIDDINNLTDNNGDSDTSNTITVEDIDTTPLDKFFEKAKSIFSKIFDPFKEAWDKQGKKVIESANKSFNNLLKLGVSIGKSLLEVWTNGTGTTIIENWLKGFQSIFDIIGGISSSLEEAWSKNNAGTTFIQAISDAFIGLQNIALGVLTSISELANNGTFTDTFSLLFGIFTDIFSIIGQIGEGLSEAWNKGNTGTQIFQSISNIFNNILKFAKSIGDIVLEWVISEDFQTALDTVLVVIKDIFGWFEDISNWLLDMYEKYVKPVLVDKVLPAINDIIQAIKDIWNVAKPVIDQIISVVKKVLEPVIKGLCDFIGGIVDIIGGIAKFVSGVFSGDWKKAWNGVKQIFVGIWDAIWGALKGILNTIIAGFEGLCNFAIRGLKKLLDPLSDLANGVLEFIGIKNFKIPKLQEVKLPRLSTGNVATEPTVALFGEYANAKSDPEITSPISMMKGAFRDVLHEIDLGGTRVDTLKIDVLGKNFFDDVIEYINEKSRRNGVSVIKEV